MTRYWCLEGIPSSSCNLITLWNWSVGIYEIYGVTAGSVIRCVEPLRRMKWWSTGVAKTLPHARLESQGCLGRKQVPCRPRCRWKVQSYLTRTHIFCRPHMKQILRVWHFCKGRIYVRNKYVTYIIQTCISYVLYLYVYIYVYIYMYIYIYTYI